MFWRLVVKLAGFLRRAWDLAPPRRFDAVTFHVVTKNLHSNWKQNWLHIFGVRGFDASEARKDLGEKDVAELDLRNQAQVIGCSRNRNAGREINANTFGERR